MKTKITTWKLSPSDLTFLWDECPRCFYLKVVHKFNRPLSPFPKIFTRIDILMKAFFEGKSTSDIATLLPEGIVKFGEKWVTSQVISLPNRAANCYIRGKVDTIVEFGDGTFGIVDFKTSEAKPDHISFYSRQLHAYAYALENPAPGGLALKPITKLGLLCVEPINMNRTETGQIAYLGNVNWMECPKDDNRFLGFLDDVLAVLEEPSPPLGDKDCSYCKYRAAARDSGF